MKFGKTLLVLAVVLVAASAVAATTATVILNSPVEVNGKKLEAGQYRIALDGDTVTFSQRGSAVASAKVKLENHSGAAPYDSVVVKTNANGADAVHAINFKGKKQAAVISEDTNTTAGN